MNRGGHQTSGQQQSAGSGGGSGPAGNYPSPYMTPYAGAPVGPSGAPGYPPTSVGGAPIAPSPGAHSDQYGTNLGFGGNGGPGQTAYYGGQPSPNEDSAGSAYYGPAGSSPRDLSYYGFNNGFVSGGGDSGSGGGPGGPGQASQGALSGNNNAAFYQQDNNNKVDAGSNSPSSSSFQHHHGDSTTQSVENVENNVKNESEMLDSNQLKLEQVNTNSDNNLNNSDNQKARSQLSPPPQLQQNSPIRLQGLPRRSPGSHESSEFEPTQTQHQQHFDPNMIHQAQAANDPDYLRQMGGQSEGKS